MREIQFYGKVGAGLKFKVSDKSFSKVSKYKWWLSRQGYAITGMISQTTGKRIMVTLHRFLKKSPKGIEIDHKDGNKFNYQLSNLRSATHQQNGMNRGRQKNNLTSQYKGVFWNSQHKKWHAKISLDRKSTHCGLFSSEIEAAKSYDNKAKVLFGKFAKLNF